MALTLNGIAQGYITDRVAALMRARGWSDVLIDLGEMRAMGVSPVGTPWTAVVDAPVHALASLLTLPLPQCAMATSSGRATAFEPSGHHHHIFSPRNGRSAGQFDTIVVTAPRAALADALSTALYVMPPEEMPLLVKAFPAVEAWLIGADGRIAHLA